MMLGYNKIIMHKKVVFYQQEVSDFIFIYIQTDILVSHRHYLSQITRTFTDIS